MAIDAKAVGISAGQCLCGKVAFEIDTPARWAWHDFSAASRRAHGAAYATYVGSWRKRFRIVKGKTLVRRFEDAATSLLDPQALAQEDTHSEGGARWVLIGMSSNARLLTVIYTLRDENRIRLISARKATRKEAEYYA